MGFNPLGQTWLNALTLKPEETVITAWSGDHETQSQVGENEDGRTRFDYQAPRTEGNRKVRHRQRNQLRLSCLDFSKACLVRTSRIHVETSSTGNPLRLARYSGHCEGRQISDLD